MRKIKVSQYGREEFVPLPEGFGNTAELEIVASVNSREEIPNALEIRNRDVNTDDFVAVVMFLDNQINQYGKSFQAAVTEALYLGVAPWSVAESKDAYEVLFNKDN